MRLTLTTLFILIFSSCDFKSSAEYNAEAERLELEGRYEEAISFLDKAIDKDPNNLYALINRGVDKSLLGDYQGAIDDYTRIIEIDPDNALAIVNRGRNKKRLEDYQGAIDDFEQAIETKGGERHYTNKVHNLLFDTGFAFEASMEEIRYERGVARYKLDRLKLALDDFNFCLSTNYKKPASLYWRGVIYLRYEMTQEGCSDLKAAQKLGDPDAQVVIDKYCK